MSPAPSQWPTTGLRGIDVSDYQHEVDYAAVAADGVAFCYVKATEGMLWSAKLFRQHWGGFEGVGLLRGAYHFLRPESDGVRQAERLVAAVEATGSPAELPCCIDFERAATMPDLSPTVMVDCALAALARVEELTGIVPIVYLGGGFFYELANGYSARGQHYDPAPRAHELARYPLWLADYQPPPRTMPWPGGWSIWQFSGSGSVPGVKGRCDMNVYRNDSEEDLTNLTAPRDPR